MHSSLANAAEAFRIHAQTLSRFACYSETIDPKHLSEAPAIYWTRHMHKHGITLKTVCVHRVRLSTQINQTNYSYNNPDKRENFMRILIATLSSACLYHTAAQFSTDDAFHVFTMKF